MNPTDPDPQTPLQSSALTRRRVFAGAGTVGALAVVAAVVPSVPKPAEADAARKLAAARTDANEGGYQLTDHVLRYYQTARV